MLSIQKKILLTLLVVLPLTAAGTTTQKADLVLVIKSQEKLFLKKGDNVIKAYNVVFGGNPVGHKQQEGDQRTPEGQYFLDYKKADSAFYKAIHISYPNESDKQRAREKGVDPGGQIMIHGQKNGFGWLAPVLQTTNWTDGCIALSNQDMEEIWRAVEVGVPIIIKP